MTQLLVNLTEFENRILDIVKGKFGVKNKSDAINIVINKFGQELLEPELRPEYVKKLKKIKKEGYGKTFTSIKELRKHIEG